MKALIKTIIVVSALVMASAFQASAQVDEMEKEIETEATYKITFTSYWNAKDHVSVPGNAHFSPLVVTAHQDEYTLLPIGEKAGDALEDVAELGRTGKIDSELSRAVRRNRALSFQITENQFVPRQMTQTVSVKVTKEFPLLSMVTMIAPSPDWVVGVDSFRTLDIEGNFKKGSTEIELFAYNAGTEDGDTAGNYSIGNPATRNQGVIKRLRGPGFRAPFAKVKLERVVESDSE